MVQQWDGVSPYPGDREGTCPDPAHISGNSWALLQPFLAIQTTRRPLTSPRAVPCGGCAANSPSPGRTVVSSAVSSSPWVTRGRSSTVSVGCRQQSPVPHPGGSGASLVEYECCPVIESRRGAAAIPIPWSHAQNCGREPTAPGPCRAHLPMDSEGAAMGSSPRCPRCSPVPVACGGCCWMGLMGAMRGFLLCSPRWGRCCPRSPSARNLGVLPVLARWGGGWKPPPGAVAGPGPAAGASGTCL